MRTYLQFEVVQFRQKLFKPGDTIQFLLGKVYGGQRLPVGLKGLNICNDLDKPIVRHPKGTFR